MSEALYRRFDCWLDNIRESAGRSMKGPLVDVLDTAHGIALWFKDEEMKATAADIVAMTALVMARADVYREVDQDDDTDEEEEVIPPPEAP